VALYNFVLARRVA